MLETGRRSAISTSELGLYSDRVDQNRHRTNRYGSVLKKFAIGVMVVVTVLLVAIFLYDFTSATSASSKVNQETKHIYILQNALKKPSNVSRRPNYSATTLPEFEPNRTTIQDRADTENYDNLVQLEDEEEEEEEETPAESRMRSVTEPEFRAQNLNNFKLRRRVLKSIENGADAPLAEGKQLFDNHAVIYRVRQRYKHPGSEEEEEEEEDAEDASSETFRPAPFRWEYKTPHPSSFKRTKYPQLSQYRYPHNSRNIQDIIKYLTNDHETPNRGIKFTGVYVNPKKYDTMIPDIGEMMSNSDRSEEEDRQHYSLNEDPFYQYKPKHPADVNLLATNNVRFSPTGLHRYHPYHDPFYPRPLLGYNKPSALDAYEPSPSYPPVSLAKKRKPKPFSVMLDIYPITDTLEQNKKASTRPRPQPLDDYETRRPVQFNRGKLYGQPPQPIPVGLPAALPMPGQQALSEEEERQQMIFHLNLYPRRKNKLSRHDIIHRSESMAADDRRQFAQKIMSPLESIAKHLTDHSAIEELKYEESSPPVTRYQETELTNEEDPKPETYESSTDVPANHKSNVDEDYASTEKYETADRQPATETSTESRCTDCETTVTVMTTTERKSVDLSRDLDTVEGFQRFSEATRPTD